VDAGNLVQAGLFDRRAERTQSMVRAAPTVEQLGTRLGRRHACGAPYAATFAGLIETAIGPGR